MNVKQKHSEIYMTTDYSMFSSMKHNRNVSEAHIHRLMKSMSEKQYPVPIVVNEKNEIADGQNRFEAIKALNLPVYYMVILLKLNGQEMLMLINIQPGIGVLKLVILKYTQYQENMQENIVTHQQMLEAMMLQILQV